MEASKWLDVPVLLSIEEMEKLFEALGPFSIFVTGSVTSLGGGELTHSTFLNSYRRYILALQEGRLPDDADYRSPFSSIFTLSSDHLQTMAVGEDRQLLRIIKPVVQLQPHTMDYSPLDGKFHSMLYGKSSLLWGLRFSYPQLFLDPDSKEVMRVAESPFFPNTALFRSIQRWVRHHTTPTPMQTPTGPVNLPVRLGKLCRSWINRHPQLEAKQLHVNVEEA